MVTSRIWFTAAQKAELWERWKNGQSAAAISRALERKNKTGVERIVVLHGGIGPAPRRRALAALRFEEREEISRGIAVGRSIRQIAQGLGRAPSTVSREIRRNGGSQAYRANRADRRARERALRPKPCRLALYSALRWRVAQKPMLIKIPRKDTTTVVAALAKHISKLPEELRRSLTWDQGKEMHAHKRFTVDTNVQVYFCDPRSPWQRGSNENTNGLLRQYLPRGTDFSRISQSYLNAIALRLNQRPRKTLGFQTPADRLQAVLH